MKENINANLTFAVYLKHDSKSLYWIKKLFASLFQYLFIKLVIVMLFVYLAFSKRRRKGHLGRKPCQSSNTAATLRVTADISSQETKNTVRSTSVRTEHDYSRPRGGGAM